MPDTAELFKKRISQNGEPNIVHYAGFWVRFEAFIIDFIICAPACILIALILESSTGIDTMVYLINASISGGVLILYFSMMEFSPMQASFGKKMMRIEVIDYNIKRISFLRSLARNLLKIISLSIFYIGFIIIAFTPKKQALHDMAAGCLVVKKRIN